MKKDKIKPKGKIEITFGTDDKEWLSKTENRLSMELSDYITIKQVGIHDLNVLQKLENILAYTDYKFIKSDSYFQLDSHESNIMFQNKCMTSCIEDAYKHFMENGV